MPTHPPAGAWLRLLRFWSALDAGEIAKAENEIQEAWAGVPGLTGLRQYQALVAFETAMFFTRFVDDASLRDEAYAFGVASGRKCPTRASADVARLFVEGRIDDARNKAAAYIGQLVKTPMCPEHTLEHVRDWFERILDPAVPVLSKEAVQSVAAGGEAASAGA